MTTVPQSNGLRPWLAWPPVFICRPCHQMSPGCYHLPEITKAYRHSLTARPLRRSLVHARAGADAPVAPHGRRLVRRDSALPISRFAFEYQATVQLAETAILQRVFSLATIVLWLVAFFVAGVVVGEWWSPTPQLIFLEAEEDD